MSNAMFFWVNDMVGAELAASAETADGKIGNVVSTRLRRAWRALASSAWFTADAGTAKPVRLLALLGVNLGASATLRLRLSSTDAHNGDLYDSGVVAAGARTTLDGRKQCLLLLPAAFNARYRKVDIDNPGGGFTDVGYAFLGPIKQFERNFSWGWGDGVDSATVQEASLGGSLYSSKRPKVRVKRFNLGFLTPAEAAQEGKDITDRAGNTGFFGMIPNPESADAAEEMIGGILRDMTETTGVALKVRSRPFELRELV